MKKTLRKYKTIIKYKLSNNKTKPMHLVILSCVIILFSFGFAFLATGVGINGVATYIAPSPMLDTASNLEFRGSTYLENITDITFNNTITDYPGAEASWDVSSDGSNSIKAYVIYSDLNYTKYSLYIESNGNIKLNDDSSELFSGMTSLTTINNIEYLETSEVENMSNMFYGCSSLTSINLSTLDTTNVTNMSSMFQDCEVVSSLDLSSFDTSNVTNIEAMFYGCSSLSTLDLSSFNTSKVTNMNNMFNCCEILSTLNISSFDTTNVSSMSNMFYNCMRLSTLDLSSFNTNSLINTSNMFYNCMSLSSLDLTYFNMSIATDMSDMFSGVNCTITIPDTTGSISNTSSIYYGSTSSVYATGTFSLVNPLNLFVSRSKVGNISSSDVGKTFTINMGSTYGYHTIRVANVSNPDACSGEDFSETACGVVLEFDDIITTGKINTEATNVGGWPASEIRTVINNTIYNSLPSNLQNAIINTNVLSSHGSTSGETNFTSTDKLYLLGAHEVWVDDDGDTSVGIDYRDTTYNNTRQLDYYAKYNITTSSYSKAIKKNSGTAVNWWLRSANCNGIYTFSSVSSTGEWSRYNSYNDFGISPAFRIEYNPPYVSDGSDLGNFIVRAKAGNATSADVGTTFTVNLGDTYGDHTLRVANVSTPTECSGDDFSGTACGVVLEFTDIIANYSINSSQTTVGGWPASGVRTFLNDTIYNSFSSNLKSAIIDTKVVSGYGPSDSSNFTSTDKIYLLSAHEIWEDVDGFTSFGLNKNDTAWDNNRQLDYYLGQGVTNAAATGAIKYNFGTAVAWWTRTFYSSMETYVLEVHTDGGYIGNYSNSSSGISPAFRVA